MKLLTRRFAQILITAFGCFFVALPALAEEGSTPNPADSPAGQIFRWLNFALVFGGIAYLIAKHGGNFFRANAQAIASSIREATSAKEEADRQLREVEAKISRLDQDVAEMREAARRDSAAEAARLEASAKAEIEKIEAAARSEMGAAERAARKELRVIVANQAVERAGSLLRSRMDNKVRSRLFQSFLGDLGRRAN